MSFHRPWEGFYASFGNSAWSESSQPDATPQDNRSSAPRFDFQSVAATTQGGTCSPVSSFDPEATSLGVTNTRYALAPCSTQPQSIQRGYCVYLKVLSPLNKKDFRMFTLRDIRPDEISTLDELKEEVFMQCGEGAQLPRTLEFTMGYFCRSQKLWINNKHDLQDAWNIVRKSEKLTLWALRTAEESKKRPRSSMEPSDEEAENVPVRYALLLSCTQSPCMPRKCNVNTHT